MNPVERAMERFKSDMTESEAKLLGLLESYPHIHHTDEDFHGVIFGIMISGRKNGWTNEFIRICEDNIGIDFHELAHLIITPERFPPIPIVEDDEMPDE